jgi:O-methyltransferase
LFDSFQGLPQPDRNFDGAEAIEMSAGCADGNHTPMGSCVASIEESRTLLIDKIGYPSELVKFHTGWFQDTIPKVAGSMGAVGLLRLDGDWYTSTKVCLDHLYSKVSDRGVVVIDDYWHFSGCRRLWKAPAPQNLAQA